MKKKSKKRVKYVDPPMKWNPGAHKYEVDLPLVNSQEKKIGAENETSGWRILLFVILVLLLTGLGGWLISILF